MLTTCAIIVLPDSVAIEEGIDADSSSVVDLSEAYVQSNERTATLLQCNQLRNNRCHDPNANVRFNICCAGTIYNTNTLWQVVKLY